MTKSTITRERLEKIKSWRETYGAGSNVTLPAEEAEELARIALAAMDSETVADDGIYRPGDAVGVFNVGCETCPDHLVAWTVKGQNLPAGNYWLYISQQPAPVVPDEVDHVAAVLELIGSFEAADIDSDTIDLRFEIDDVDTGAEASITEYAARGAAIIRQLSGDSPVIPDGYVMVPKEPTPEILATITEAIRAMRGSAATYARVLAAAQQEVM
ncbi:hypothetical protein [Raoultella planticola]|uniref:hypothetical protein n=1 Tax=Raoultella planticola TaxID=575 RepID=UPI001D0CE683|nr:hypothetical protein [Raoultella planticola]